MLARVLSYSVNKEKIKVADHVFMIKINVPEYIFLSPFVNILKRFLSSIKIKDSGKIVIFFYTDLKITTFYDKTNFLKKNYQWRRVSSRLRLPIIKKFHITKIKIYSFFFKSKKLRKIILKKWSQKFTEYSKKCDKNSFKQIERGGRCVSIHWWSISHYKEVFFQFLKVALILVTLNTKILKRGFIGAV